MLNLNRQTRPQSILALTQMVIVAAVVLAVCVWQREFLSGLYVQNQVSGGIGWAINGAIAALFLAGMLRLVTQYLVCYREEAALDRFLQNQREMVEPPTQRVAPGSIIARRYETMNEMYERRAAINHNVLAATLMAEETSRNTLLKFVNNVLILTGVFGTIVSLSIALLGASSMVASTTELGGLGTVIQGMSTAMSTTITAIVAFLFFGYFYVRLQDIQTHIISATEFVTTTELMPRFQRGDADAVAGDYSEMLRSVNALVDRLGGAVGALQATQEQLSELALQSGAPQTREVLEQIKELLRTGFRLSEAGERRP